MVLLFTYICIGKYYYYTHIISIKWIAKHTLYTYNRLIDGPINSENYKRKYSYIGTFTPYIKGLLWTFPCVFAYILCKVVKASYMTLISMYICLLWHQAFVYTLVAYMNLNQPRVEYLCTLDCIQQQGCAHFWEFIYVRSTRSHKLV